MVTTQHPDSTGRAGTFDLKIGGKEMGYLSYSLEGDDGMVVDFVQVDPSLRGKGQAVKLIAAAVDWARANGRKITPTCSYARAVMHRTREFQDVLAE